MLRTKQRISALQKSEEVSRIVWAAAMIVAFGIAFALIPMLRRAAVRLGFVDLPGKRKIHNTPIPLLGGVAIYLGCSAAMLGLGGVTPGTLSIVTGGLPLMAIGLTDDWFKTSGRDFHVWPRLIGYGFISCIPLFFGIHISGITRFFSTGSPGMIVFGPGLGVLATSVWIFALINMINFIDGVDGLAAGITGIAAITLIVLSIIKGQHETAVLAAAVAGASIAFWIYNFYPAKMFMGDAGATFLGYALAVITVDGAFKSAALLSLFPPVLALGVPILDTGIVMFRRLLQGGGLHRADKLHTHHSLMRWGLSQTQTVSFLYLIGVIFSLLSILFVVVIEW